MHDPTDQFWHAIAQLQQSIYEFTVAMIDFPARYLTRLYGPYQDLARRYQDQRRVPFNLEQNRCQTVEFEQCKDKQAQRF